MEASAPKPLVLIVGATGNTGSAAVKQLRAAQWPVRAAVRVADSRSARLSALGAEVVCADMFDAVAVAAAFRGVKRAYFVPPIHALAVHAAALFAHAARAETVEHVVLLSQWLAGASRPSLLSRQHVVMDDMFRSLEAHGIGCTIVRPGFFADLPYVNLGRYAAQLGVLPLPVLGSARDAPPSVEDIARVVVAALRDPERHRGRDYRPTGPELLTVDQMVAIMSREFGRNVTHLHFMPRWLLHKAAIADGFSDFTAAQFGYYLDDLAAGGFAHGGPTGDVLEATGVAPESFEAVCRRYATQPSHKRTFGSVAVAAWRFFIVPFKRGLDVASYERQHELPRAPKPLLAGRDDAWKAAVTKARAADGK